ncbi:hypothetical protein EDB81DRAFT_827868 [Dactylonectria macrodidyma]|uniref:Chromo domain-containing protein n=1 Tax=Dactylonectria macrodidyma TaxID=307937 RepID=A0A9P9D4E3_9HYPO|nr:hypothetical protein EDB81DRAFT_827868 [Dactylonectria macrodidyma]
MIIPIYPQIPDRGTQIETPWSAQVTVREVLVTTHVNGWIFYGVLAETQDGESWDWLLNECLLWVFNDGTGFRMWQDPSQPSGFSSQEPECKFEKIVGHYASSTGECFLAVKWKDRLSPTWEPEQDMVYCANAVTNYFIRDAALSEEARG